MKQIGARFDVYKPSNGIRNGEMNLQLCLTTINMKNILNFFGFVCHLSYFSFFCVFTSQWNVDFFFVSYFSCGRKLAYVYSKEFKKQSGVVTCK